MARKPWGQKFDAGRCGSLCGSLCLRWMVVMVICLCCPACRWLTKQHDPYGFTANCQIQPGLPQAEILARVNANIERVRGWRDTSAKISVSGIPIVGGVGASIAVEGPRNVRIVAKHPLTKGIEADLGSNDQQFWFWVANQGQDEVITCKHENVAYAAGMMPIPFEPDWLMEALGVVPLDENIDYMYDRPGTNLVELQSSHISPSGEQVIKRVTVDRCHWLVREHALLDANGTIIAQATLSNYVKDEVSGGFLPKLIQLEWATAKMKLTIRLNNIQFNPSSVPIAQWQIPRGMKVRAIDPPSPQGQLRQDVIPAGGIPAEENFQEAEFQQPIRADSEGQ